MTANLGERTVLVQMPESLMNALLQARASLSAAHVHILRAGSASAADAPGQGPKAPPQPSAKYAGEFLRVSFEAQTLPDVFAQVVNMTAAAAPEALDQLAGMGTPRRRFIARTRDAVHPARPDLDARSTASGWWINANISQKDLTRALRALCDAAGLSFGTDVKFMRQRGGH